MSVTRRDKKKKTVEEDGLGRYGADGGKKDREKRRSKDIDGGPSSYEGKKPKLKDVTNSPPPRPSLATIDFAHGKLDVSSCEKVDVDSGFIDRERQRTPISDTPSTSVSSSNPPRSFLATPAPKTSLSSYLPTPRASSPAPPPEPELEPEPELSSADPSTGGRERRVRKSINYAEPKLNTCVMMSICVEIASDRTY